MEEALIAWLLSEASITAGANGVGNRIWPADRPTPALPAITIEVPAQNAQYTHEGKTDLLYPRVQFDVWGKSYTQAKIVSRALSALIEQGKDRPTAIFFEGIEVNNSDMDPDTLSGGTKVFRVMIEFLVPYKLKGA